MTGQRQCAESTRVCDTDECCQNDSWQGDLCPYHRGFWDGYDQGLAVQAMRDEAARIDGEVS